MICENFLKIIFKLIIITLALLSSIIYANPEEFSGSVQPIPNKIRKHMIGYTWNKNCPVPLDDLSYLSITYYGFDHKNHIGHLIILNNLALETLQIFRTLYRHKFPIERMVLPSSYKSTDDWKSTEHNNTLGFFCRKDDQTTTQFSKHSYGVAIDINPKYNPAPVSNHKVQPENGAKYLNRKLKHQGMIKKNSMVVNLFTHYGWNWGGYWPPTEVDYMHFQKAMDSHYTCTHMIYTHINPKPLFSR